jgi:solute:Na+ symporter, SSS family
MTIADYIIVIGYFAVMLLIGLMHQSKASASVKSYFLGSNKIPWWITSMSLTMASIDITGTMVNVTLLYYMGIRFFYYNIWVLSSVALMCHLGRWIRRSQVVTAAEWMTTRFGKGWAGELPRLTVAIVSLGLLLGYIAYAFVGVGKFVSEFVPMLHSDPIVNARIWGIVIIGFTALYALLGGLFSVAYTDLIQTFILVFTSIYITVLAFVKVNAVFIAENTPAGWDKIMPSVRIDYLANVELAGYPEGAFEAILPWLMMWCFQTLLAFFSGPGVGTGMQFMLATPSARDTCKQCAGMQLLAFPRWTLVAGLALLALTTSMEVKDTDMLLPQMINSLFPWGFKGLVMVGFLAAFMSTFSIAINNGCSYLLQDIYLRHLRPGASRKEFIRVTYISSAVIVIVGILIGSMMHNILELGIWVYSILASSMIIPLILRWYWWRFNGWAFATGTVAAFTVAVGQKVLKLGFDISWPDYYFYLVMIVISAVSCIAVAFITPATDRETLVEFYRKIQPWGFWGPVKREVMSRWPELKIEKMFALDMFNCAVGAVSIFCLNLLPFYFMLHNWDMFFRLLTGFGVTAFILYFSWYKTLPTD